MILVDFLCESHGVFEKLVRRNEMHSHPCPTCGASSAWTPSAPKIYMPVGVVVSGSGPDERPPHALDTRPLADGTPTHKWRREEREKMRVSVRDKILKEMG